ncbi:YkgJ family cysteine cluster protein [Pseudodesulfovibrio sp. F-1]|uniref:YkgJ family cysteine cluster protein n=1 Tax=Pseudodesulfovibrio alkaliphilus TaxID=2661613 RepID=A0A7K1KN41_9BACT|nr:YkgJ family cysteine cluster protein [Pseudodesulfovibrio alkaliphilus]MUM77498.1 YkgJ family cysteine cluster protein [Pseudodesulfovibrio alkaliphilus]
MHDDQTKEFLASLPELEQGKTYHFRCHPDIACFNACCSDLNLVLTPYDILRLRRSLGLGSVDFLRAHTTMHRVPDTGFPEFRLRMIDNQARSCPFVRDAGCSVYPDRPGACRMYPLGRATRPDGQGGVREHFFIVREDHCLGFAEPHEWTGDSWKQDQGFLAYTASNDRFMHLLARIRQTGSPVPEKMGHMATLALYKLDEFQRFIVQTRLFDRLEMDAERREAVLKDEAAALEFALDWLELMLFQTTPNLVARRAS